MATDVEEKPDGRSRKVLLLPVLVDRVLQVRRLHQSKGQRAECHLPQQRCRELEFSSLVCTCRRAFGHQGLDRRRGRYLHQFHSKLRSTMAQVGLVTLDGSRSRGRMMETDRSGDHGE